MAEIKLETNSRKLRISIEVIVKEELRRRLKRRSRFRHMQIFLRFQDWEQALELLTHHLHIFISDFVLQRFFESDDQ